MSRHGFPAFAARYLSRPLYFALVLLTTAFCLSLLSVAIQDGGLSALEVQS